MVSTPAWVDAGTETAGVLHQPAAAPVPLPRHEQQHRRQLDRSRHDVGVRDRTGVLPDRLVHGGQRRPGGAGRRRRLASARRPSPQAVRPAHRRARTTEPRNSRHACCRVWSASRFNSTPWPTSRRWAPIAGKIASCACASRSRSTSGRHGNPSGTCGHRSSKATIWWRHCARPASARRVPTA